VLKLHPSAPLELLSRRRNECRYDQHSGPPSTEEEARKGGREVKPHRERESKKENGLSSRRGPEQRSIETFASTSVGVGRAAKVLEKDGGKKGDILARS